MKTLKSDEELMHELQKNSEFNPWRDVADQWLSEFKAGNYNGDYIHPNDGAAIADYKEKLKRVFSRNRYSKSNRYPKKKGVSK